MYKKILVPLDGSKRAEMIGPHVRELACRYEATVIFLSVIEHAYTNGIGETFSSISEEAFEAKLKESESYLERYPGGFHLGLMQGRIALGIARADLLTQRYLLSLLAVAGKNVMKR